MRKAPADTLRTLLAAGLLAATVLVGVGCNTVKGVGEDIQSAGEAGERAIDGDADGDGQ